MKYLLTMILFSSIASADGDMVGEGQLSIPVEEMEYITLRGDSLPAPDSASAIIYPIEEFIRLKEDELE